jgi:hypothetical protein
MITKENEITRFFAKLGWSLKIHKPKKSRYLNTRYIIEYLGTDPDQGDRLAPFLTYYFKDVKEFGFQDNVTAFIKDFNPEGHGITGICKRCGCSQNDACYDTDTGSCYWVKEDLCSACATPAEKAVAMEEMRKLDGSNHG